MALDRNLQYIISTALKVGDFDSALPWLSSDQISELFLSDQRTPLHYACQHGRVDVAQRLITNCQCSIESKDVQGCTPLHTAAQYGQVETLKYLLHRLFNHEVSGLTVKLTPGGKLSHTLTSKFQQKLSDRHREQSGNTPLHTACVHGQLDIVQLLTHEIGCDPNNTNSEGLSCLHLAAQNGHLPLVRYLVEEVGSDATLEDDHGRSPIYLGAGKGHLDILKYLIMIEEKGASKEWKTASFTMAPGRSLVHTASREGHLHVVRYLVEHHGCDPSCKGVKGITPLHLACQEGHMDIVSYLITEAHCDPNCASECGRTCLHSAIIRGRLDVITYLFANHNCEIRCDSNGWAPLHFAAALGKLDVAIYLIENMKCDPNSKGQYERTPLHHASENGHPDVVRYLVETCHCDPLCTDKSLQTPMHRATIKGHLNVVCYFVTTDPNNSLIETKLGHAPLHLAALNGHLQVVKLLTEDMKCDPNLKGRFERTPLHHASRNGHLNVVKYLIEKYHCDPLCPDESLHTPMHRAVIEGHLDVVRYFMTMDPNNLLIATKLGNAPLHLAALYGHLQVVKLLTEDMKCDPNLKGQFERIPLHHASENGHLDVVRYLVETHKCDPLCPDELLHTPIHRAANMGQMEVIRYFVITFQNILWLIETKFGDTPLHLAALNGLLEVVKFLVEDMKCDPNFKDSQKKMPLHHASEKGHLGVVKYLVDTCHSDPLYRDELHHTSLHKAVIGGQLKVVRYFVNIDLIHTLQFGIALLHIAVLHGHLDVARFFIEDLNFHPNSKNHHSTPLHCACENGHLHIVKFLVNSSGCDPLCRDDSQHTPLHRAVIKGHLEVVRYFVFAPNMFLTKTELGDTLLHLSAQHGHLGIVKFLIEDVKCDPNIKGQQEKAPLHHASERGHLGVVKYLVDVCHCDPLCPDLNKYTPLHEASAKGQFEVVLYYILTLGCYHSPKDEDNNTPLHHAAHNGHLEVVDFIIGNMRCDPSSTGKLKRTPLHFASESGHLEIVKYLVDHHHCNPLYPDEVKQTPLHRAAANGHMEVVFYFTLTRGCNSLIRDAYNNVPLLCAAQNGHHDMVKFFIDNMKCGGMSRGQHQRTPLHFASESGNLEVVKYLVDYHHCDPLCLDEEKQTPLHRAAACGHMEVVRYFTLVKGCDCLIRDIYSNTPLHYASRNGYLEVMKFFIKDLKCGYMSKGQHHRTPLHQASVGGHLGVVEYLVKVCGCDPFFVDYYKQTSLHLASLEGNLNVARYLESKMDCRKNIMRDQYSRTPLHCAAVCGHLDVVKFFIDDLKYNPIPLSFATHDIKMYFQDVTASYFSADKNSNELHCAALNGDREMVQFLIEESKCDPNCKDQRRKVTPLHHACENGHANVVEYLLKLPNCDKQTALHAAASNGHLSIVKCLVQRYKCSFLARNQHGNTPLHLAVYYNHLEVVKYFIEMQGCDPNIKGEQGCTPLHLSLKYKYFELSKYLIRDPRCDVFAKYFDHTSTVDCILLAVQTRSLEVLQFLCKTRRLDPYFHTGKGRLLRATGDVNIIKYLDDYTDPLHYAAEQGDVDTVSYFVESRKWDPNMLDRHGNNTLHHAAKHGQLEVVMYLTGLNKDPAACNIEILCDPLTKNISGLTAQLLASQNGHHSLVHYFFRTAINQPMLHKDVLSPFLNIFVVGNTGSGKSTLVKALTAQSTPVVSRFVKVKDVTPLTTGIQCKTLNSEVFGNAHIYDFAGHEEYYASHEIVLQQTIQPLVLLTLDISLHRHVIKKHLLYWFAVLSNTATTDRDIVQCTHVVVVGSHADRLSQKQRNEIDKQVASLANNSPFLKYHGYFPCDCRYSLSDNLSKLLQKLSSICRQIQLILVQNENEITNQSCARLMCYLNSQREIPVTIAVSDLWQLIKSTKYLETYLPNQDVFIKTCKTLSSNRHLMFLPQEDNIEQSLLVLNERVVLSTLHSCLPDFEKEGNNFGMLDEKQLKQILSKNLGNMLEPEFATRYLLLTQFCAEISADHLVDCAPSSISNRSYYFFPNLVHASRPDNLLCQGKHDYTDFYTWSLKCGKTHQFFTPRFLPALFIQITKFDGDTANSEYTIWKNGILFVHSNGTRSIVEVTDQITQLCFSIQCVEGCELQMVKHRSMLISLIRNLVSKTCPAVEVEEFLLLPDSNYPPANTTEVPLSKLAYSVINGLPTVPFKALDESAPEHIFIKQLLHFDSFHAIEDCVLRELTSHSQCAALAPQPTLCTVHSAIKGFVELAKLLEDRTSEDGMKELTYSQLYQLLVKYSIFTSENLYVSITINNCK